MRSEYLSVWEDLLEDKYTELLYIVEEMLRVEFIEYSLSRNTSIIHYLQEWFTILQKTGEETGLARTQYANDRITRLIIKTIIPKLYFQLINIEFDQIGLKSVSQILQWEDFLPRQIFAVMISETLVSNLVGQMREILTDKKVDAEVLV